MINNFTPFPIIETERLVLRSLALDDAKEILNYQSNKDNFPFVDMPVYKELSEAILYIEKMNKGVKEDKYIIWAIEYNGNIVGTISLWNFNYETDVAETGYGLFSARGNGIMTEALEAVTEFAFKVMKLKRVEAFTNKLNLSSIKLLKNVGFEFSNNFLEEFTISGSPMEMVVYKKEV